MQRLVPADVRPPSQYHPVRSEARRNLIELRRDRRVRIGDLVELCFENRDSVRGLVEEVCDVENIEDPQRIAEEVAIFNTLIPDEGELSATLFLELDDWIKVATSSQLHGLEWCVELCVGGTCCPAFPSDGGDPDGRTSCVHYLRFPLTPPQRRAFCAGEEISIAIAHRSYVARSVLSTRQRIALAPDLR